jgi:hypothetical protein
MADSAFPVLGSPENWALQYSQIPSTGTFLTRFTILRLRFAMPTVSHRPIQDASPVDFKLHTTGERRDGCMINALFELKRRFRSTVFGFLRKKPNGEKNELPIDLPNLEDGCMRTQVSFVNGVGPLISADGAVARPIHPLPCTALVAPTASIHMQDLCRDQVGR